MRFDLRNFNSLQQKFSKSVGEKALKHGRTQRGEMSCITHHRLLIRNSKGTVDPTKSLKLKFESIDFS